MNLHLYAVIGHARYRVDHYNPNTNTYGLVSDRNRHFSVHTSHLTLELHDK